MNSKKVAINNALSAGYTYKEYRELVSEHVIFKTTSGPNQTDALINYTKLNHARMKRLDKTTIIPQAHQTLFSNYQKKLTWLVLSESWCGDAAQSLPVLNKIALLMPQLTFKIVFRDQHKLLMEYFKTNNAMAIPKLIIIDHTSKEVVGQWGPRPSIASKTVASYKAAHGTLSKEFKKELQVWYTQDKGRDIIEDISRLLITL
ncbi:MAG: thioredoxin family protein [Patiriisocius sp.]